MSRRGLDQPVAATTDRSGAPHPTPGPARSWTSLLDRPDPEFHARKETTGTWIVPQMQTVYAQAHLEGFVHSVETWENNQLVGGLYCVSLGKAVYGESMFSLQKDASKIALAALVAFSIANGIAMIDCQQNTPHLSSLGAAQIPRSRFLELAALAQSERPPQWEFSPDYWGLLGMHDKTNA